MNADRKHKLTRRDAVTNAAVHDSQKLDDVHDPNNTASGVWADSAYRSKESEEKLGERCLKSHVCRRGARGKPLSERGQAANRGALEGSLARRTSVRRPDDDHGRQDPAHDRDGAGEMKIGMQNLAYNMRRFVTLERMAAAA